MRRTISTTVAAAIAGLFLLACGPLPPPARVVPTYDALSGAPAPGSSRVVLDVQGRRCRVRLADHHRLGRVLVQQAKDAQGRFVLCVTPCQVELRRGPHRLRFCEEADVTVFVRSRPTIVRVAVDGHRTPGIVQWAPR